MKLPSSTHLPYARDANPSPARTRQPKTQLPSAVPKLERDIKPKLKVKTARSSNASIMIESSPSPVPKLERDTKPSLKMEDDTKSKLNVDITRSSRIMVDDDSVEEIVRTESVSILFRRLGTVSSVLILR